MILDGTAAAAARRRALAGRMQHSVTLGIILATDNQATRRYVDLKRQAGREVGVDVQVRDLGPEATAEEIKQAVEKWNGDPEITGYIVQLPLPSVVPAEDIIDLIVPEKDADGLTLANRRLLGKPSERVVPAPAKAILSLLETYDLPVGGRRATVIGKGWSAGRPIAEVLRSRGAEVTVADSTTADLAAATRSADILIAVAGRPGLVRGDMVKPGAVVIDVGANRVRGKLVGDVDLPSVSEVATAIAPVPGGVGPMTVVSLLENVYDLGLAATKN